MPVTRARLRAVLPALEPIHYTFASSDPGRHLAGIDARVPAGDGLRRQSCRLAYSPTKVPSGASMKSPVNGTTARQPPSSIEAITLMAPSGLSSQNT